MNEKWSTEFSIHKLDNYFKIGRQSRCWDPNVKHDSQIKSYDIEQKVLKIVVLKSVEAFNPFSAGTDFRSQIRTSNVGPRTESIKKIIMTVDP